MEELRSEIEGASNRVNKDVIVTSDAANHVLTTYELLESILTNLPLKDLLRAQQVRKSFSDVAGRSKVLRQHKFVEPAKYEAPDQDAEPFHPYYFAPDHTTLDPQIPSPHPLQGDSFNAVDSYNLVVVNNTFALSEPDLSIVQCTLYEKTFRHLLSLPKGRQWKKTYACQPPVQLMSLQCHRLPIGHEQWRGTRAEYKIVENRNGVRIGDVVRGTRRMLKPNNFFFDRRGRAWAKPTTIVVEIGARDLCRQ